MEIFLKYLQETLKILQHLETLKYHPITSSNTFRNVDIGFY